MNIKSLIIGSAAALVAVTGARAADAVVMPEPEAVEYVRVCDMYGAKFFYIPGTETCLAISGYVRYRIDVAQGTNGWQKAARVRVNFDVRSETELGMLQGYVRIQNGGWDPQNQVGTVATAAGALVPATRVNYGGDGVAYFDQAWLALGGLVMGYTESVWTDSKNGGASNYGSHTDTGLGYGYLQTNLIAYRFGGNGFFGAVSLEDDGNNNFIPDLVGKVGYEGAWGVAWAQVAYDEDIALPAAAFVGARAAGLSNLDGYAGKLGLTLNMPNMPGSSLRLQGFYSNNANRFSAQVGGRWSVLASYGQAFSPKLFASVGVQYIGDTNWGAAGNPSAWRVEAQVVVTPVTNFEIRAEISHTKPTGVRGTTQGFLWFQRSF